MTTVARVGPANGKWLVNTITQNVYDSSHGIIVKLEKPLPPKNEKATSGSSSSSSSGSGSAQSAFDAASKLSEMTLPYVLGGGHGSGLLAQVQKNGFGLDCSSSTSWILHEAGMFSGTTAWDSTEFAAKFGEPGEGQEMTVWANAQHVWIEFKIPGHAHARADTVGGTQGEGPRLRSVWPPPEGTTGFTPRHWPGT